MGNFCSELRLACEDCESPAEAQNDSECRGRPKQRRGGSKARTRAMARVTLNVRGQLFTVYRASLQRYPDTRLGRLAPDSEEYDPLRDEYFFDRDVSIVPAILDFYSHDELHLPQQTCGQLIRRELQYWELPEDVISECCYKSFKQHLNDIQTIDTIDSAFGVPVEEIGKVEGLKQRIWLIMQRPNYGVLGRIWNFIYVTFIFTAVVVFILSSTEGLRVPRQQPVTDEFGNPLNISTDTHIIGKLVLTDAHEFLNNIDYACFIFFTLELTLRLWVCPRKGHFLTQFLNIVDILLVAIMWCSFLLDKVVMVERPTYNIAMAIVVVRGLMGMRVLRILHLARRYDKMKIIYLSVQASFRELMLCLIGFMIAFILFGSLAYVAEILGGTYTFNDIPIAIWWAIITMTTVGYGDYYPASFLGYVVGVCCAVSGILFLSMPVAIVASNFTSYNHNMAPRDQRHRRRKHPMLASKFKANGVSDGEDDIIHGNNRESGCDGSSDNMGDEADQDHHDNGAGGTVTRVEPVEGGEAKGFDDDDIHSCGSDSTPILTRSQNGRPDGHSNEALVQASQLDSAVRPDRGFGLDVRDGTTKSEVSANAKLLVPQREESDSGFNVAKLTRNTLSVEIEERLETKL